jgi:hypothetical protein
MMSEIILKIYKLKTNPGKSAAILLQLLQTPFGVTSCPALPDKLETYHPE